MKRIVFVTVMMLTMQVSVIAQAQGPRKDEISSVEHEIRRLEALSREATLKNDAEVLNQLLADNWMNTNAGGTVTTKAQLIEILKTNAFKFISIENDDVKVRVYGDAAVVTGRSKSTRIGRDNTPVTGEVRFTRVYAKPDGRWQVVSAQSTPITQQ
jgi:uncharacterized protein (TIGR02246 family)